MKNFILLLPLLFVSVVSADSTADAFVKCLSGSNISAAEIPKIVYSPNNPSFGNVLDSLVRNRRFNTSTTIKPNVIVTPMTEAHVSAAVLCAKKAGIQIKIRSGGHDYEGLSYVSDGGKPFVIIDMFNFRSIQIDAVKETAWVGAGALLGELYYRIWEKSKVHAFPAGLCPTVAAGGHISGAGYGTLIRKYGLTVDYVTDAKIVNAAGKVLDRKSMGEDLFWAIRGGGGGSFGVILGYQIKLVRVPAVVTVFRLEKYLDQNATEAVFQYQQIAEKVDDNLWIRILIQPVTRNKTKTTRATFIGQFLGPASGLLPITNSQFPTLNLKPSDCHEVSWIQAVLFWSNFDNTTSPKVLLNRNSDSVSFLKRKSDYVKTPISLPNLKAIFNKMAQIGKVGLVFNTYGGRMSKIPATETPFPHRAGNLYKIQYSVSWKEEGKAADANYIKQIRELYTFMTPFVSSNPRESYLNYRDLDIGTNDHGKNSYSQGKVYGEKYFKVNFDRLVKVKTQVDPDNVFRNEQSIPVQSGSRKTGTNFRAVAGGY